MAKKKHGELEPVGKKIKTIRLSKKMTLDRVANETGYSIDYIKDLEAGNVIPPVGTLLQLARALEVDSGLLLREQENSLQARVEEYAKRTDNYAYLTLTPGAENKHLKAFKISIDPMQDHQGVGYHHEGEEFVYVLTGKVEVTVGEHVNKLDQGESLHFNSGIRHKLSNVGEAPAELIVVIYAP